MMKFLIVIVAMTASFFLYAQEQQENISDPEVDYTSDVVMNEAPGVSVDDWLNKGLTPVVSILMIIGGYLVKWIPGLKKIPNKTYRVFALALIIAGCYVAFGKASFMDAAFAYAGAVTTYDVALKKLFGTYPPPDNAKT